MHHITNENKTKHALLVESNLHLQALQQDVLADLGFQVTVAIDGRAATQLLAARVFELIILHEALPTVNALLLMKIIHYSTQSYRNKNAMICLAYSTGELVDELTLLFWAHGFRHFLTVPVTAEALQCVWDKKRGVYQMG